MSEEHTDDRTPPTSSHPGLDAALAEVADLSEVPLTEHHSRLERAHQALHEVLTAARPTP
jgi:hypothetical protein